MNRSSIGPTAVVRIVAAVFVVLACGATNTAAQAVPPAPASGPSLVVTIRREIVAPALSDKWRTGAALFMEVVNNLVLAVTPPVEEMAENYPARFASLLEEKRRELEPERSVLNLVVSVKADRMRVDIGGSSLLARLAPDGSVAEWGVLDQASGRVLQSRLFDETVRGASATPFASPAEVQPRQPMIDPMNESRVIEGYPARRYHFLTGVNLFPFGRADGAPMIALERSGSAWIARDSDIPDRELADLLARWAQSFGDQGDLGRELDRIWPGSRALLLGLEDTTRVGGGYFPQGPNIPVLEGWSSVVLTDVSRKVLPDSRFSGFEQQKQRCDCSCDALWKLREIGKLPRAEQEKHREAMPLAMCGARCNWEWSRCKNAPK